MIGNMKKFLEVVSKDKELSERLKVMTEKAEIIAEAANLGIMLTEADFEVTESEMSDKELSGISGGDCLCAMAGGGGGTDAYDGKTYGCACVLYGQGGDGSADDFNCCCVAGGAGVDGNVAEGDGFSFM